MHLETAPREFAQAPRAGQCPLCGCVVPPQEPYITRASWTYSRCPECQLVFLNPSPDDHALRSYYNDGYEVDFKRYQQGLRARSKGILQELGAHLPRRGKLLEIGCSYGGFLAEARKLGWEVQGIELSEDASRYAREKLGVTVYTGTLEDQMICLDGPFDAIALFHVIEHVRDPLGFLQLCCTLLCPGGLLVLKTPNVESLVARLAGPLWQWVSPPAHLVLFSPETLELLLHRAGYLPLGMWSLQGDAHSNLFEGAGWVAKRLFSRSGEGAIKKVQQSKGKRMAEAVCDAIYFPFRFVVDPWLAWKMLQPELHALASRPE